ncbi:hypothetical protein M3172_16030 [Mesobacillus subterraneus]|uniref:hypothetical protein n=1 Tax=Mesobacillus subterraneus TaxID=285983 RepID=UPI00203AE9C0|nr:hypothetical protein [Mesobacillus subterraneus]MCM3574706.1 hypothetical protein [Mesobacillus subterraneus]
MLSNRETIRTFVYKNILLKKLWLQVIKTKDKYQFQHWKILNKIYFYYLIKVKKYEEIKFEKKIVNGMFKIFINRQNYTVVKVIKKDNTNSYSFYKKMKSKKYFMDYLQVIENACNIPIIGEHATKVVKVFRNGGYIAPYIHGENLQVIKLKLISGEFFLEPKEWGSFFNAIDTLYVNLERYHNKYNNITGDWMLYNLMYDLKSKSIINIDLEGFYTWSGNQRPNDIVRIKKDLDNIKNLITDKMGGNNEKVKYFS